MQGLEIQFKDSGFMGFVKFVFVLLIMVPIAVFMIYLINNLNKALREDMKNSEKEGVRSETAAGKSRPSKRKRSSPVGSRDKRQSESSRAPEHRAYVSPQQYSRARAESSAELGGSFGREIPDKDRYKQDSPYYISKKKYEAGKNAAEGSRADREISGGRKSSKKRKGKNKKKVREKQK